MTAPASSTPDEEALKLAKICENFGANHIYLMSGIGVGFRGRDFKSEGDRAANIELRTRWVIGLWLPLIPIGSYRIRRSNRMSPDDRAKRVLELFSHEPMAWRQVFRWWSLIAAGIALLLVVYYLSW